MQHTCRLPTMCLHMSRVTRVCPCPSMQVCKRKCSDSQRCTPCKQPRCSFAAPDAGLDNRGGGGETASNSESGQCHLPLCPLPSSPSSSSPSTSSSSSSLPADGCCGMVLNADSAQSSDSSSCCLHQYGEHHARSFETDHLSINHLPSSILLKVRPLSWLLTLTLYISLFIGFFFFYLKVLSHLTVKERCLCASLVCKYWRDLCLDFQFWKQIDLSGLQQVILFSRVAVFIAEVVRVNVIVRLGFFFILSPTSQSQDYTFVNWNQTHYLFVRFSCIPHWALYNLFSLIYAKCFAFEVYSQCHHISKLE